MLLKAKKHFLHALKIYPGSNDALLATGTIYYSYFGMRDSAVYYLEKVDTTAPFDYLRAREKIGDMYAKDNDREKAFEYYQQGFYVFPKDLFVYQKIMDHLLQTEQYDKIIPIADIGIKNEWLEAYVNKGDALLNLKDTTQAMFFYEMAFKKGLKSDVLVNNLRNYYNMTGQKQKLRFLPQ
jgi:tetratricopeptide (TPR) repeat protein